MKQTKRSSRPLPPELSTSSGSAGAHNQGCYTDYPGISHLLRKWNTQNMILSQFTQDVLFRKCYFGRALFGCLEELRATEVFHLPYPTPCSWVPNLWSCVGRVSGARWTPNQEFAIPTYAGGSKATTCLAQMPSEVKRSEVKPKCQSVPLESCSFETYQACLVQSRKVHFTSLTYKTKTWVQLRCSHIRNIHHFEYVQLKHFCREHIKKRVKFSQPQLFRNTP